MAVKIRLKRMGMKGEPFYRIVVADSRTPRDGRFIDRIGYYNPMAAGQAVRLNVNQERLAYWQSQGAQLSESVARLVKEAKAAA